MSALFKAPRPEELPQRFDNPAGPSQPSDTAQKLLLSPEELIAAAGRRAAGLPGHTPLAGAPSPRQQASLGVEPNSPAAASEAPGAPTPNPAGTEALAAEEPRTRVKVQEDERASDEAEGAYAKKLLRDDPSFAIEDVYNDKTLNLGAKRRLLEMAKNIPLPEPSAEDSKAAAADLLGRIRRPSGDPEKITGRAPITEAFNAHKLTKADFELVEQELADSRTPDGERLAQRKQAFVESRSPSTAPGDTGAATEPAPAPSGTNTTSPPPGAIPPRQPTASTPTSNSTPSAPASPATARPDATRSDVVDRQDAPQPADDSNADTHRHAIADAFEAAAERLRQSVQRRQEPSEFKSTDVPADEQSGAAAPPGGPVGSGGAGQPDPGPPSDKPSISEHATNALQHAFIAAGLKPHHAGYLAEGLVDVLGTFTPLGVPLAVDDMQRAARRGDWLETIAAAATLVPGGRIVKLTLKVRKGALVLIGRAAHAKKGGHFLIANWPDYLHTLSKPKGPFRLIKGKGYVSARRAANKENRAAHAANRSLSGKHIHEIHPIKFGGNPIDPTNKMPLDPSTHYKVSEWWARLKRAIEKY
jgi:hypothetical protein